MINNLIPLLSRLWRVLLFSSMLIVLAIIALVQLFANFGEDVIVTAEGRHNLSFNIFYVENDDFPTNPIPRYKDFLMSYTDFIEVESSFSANFSQETHIRYSYSAVKRLQIRQIGGDDNRFVLQDIFPLAEGGGEVVSDSISIAARNSGGNAHRIYPPEFIEPYLQFIANQMRQMHTRGMVAQGLRGFSAELLVEFSYTIHAPYIGMSETLTYGYRIPLTNEVFTLSEIGMRSFDWASDPAQSATPLTFPVIAMFVAAFCLCVLGLRYSLLKLNEDQNEYRKEANAIIKKYADVIVVSNEQPELSGYTWLSVKAFEELFKLAINLNKHIMCHDNEDFAMFAIVVENHAYTYTINFEPDDSNDESITGPKHKKEKVHL